MKHTFFYINEKSSKDFNAYIIFEDSLQFFTTPEFSNEFAYPKYTNTNVLLGVNKENKIFNFRILLKEVSLEGYNNFLEWVDIEEIFKFRLDFQKEDGYYTVKVNSISAGEYALVGCEPEKDLFNIELTLELVTVGDWAFHVEEEVEYTEVPFPYNPDSPLGAFIIIEGEGTQELNIDSNHTIFKKTEENLSYKYNSFLGLSFTGNSMTPLGEYGELKYYLMKKRDKNYQIEFTKTAVPEKSIKVTIVKRSYI